ncbi:MAG: hypothetical protein GX456_18705, partial [Verrucomicrobia bacterium]|nr:hypothetical protein [Verrucomicrobiota bacterium]
MLVSKPPKGGTLAAVGVPSPRAWANPPPLEFSVYAEPRPNPKTLSRLSRSFAVETTWGGARARKSHRLTRPRHPKLHSGEISGPGWYRSGLRP